MPSFATGTRAFGFCGRCDRRVPLNELVPQVINLIPTGLLVCDSCLDIDQEQLQVGKMFRAEPMALKNPRPDISRPGSIGFYGWNPLYGVQAFTAVGVLKPTVT